ncbi:MAG TPA: hypothetical protein VEP69_02200, partial [Thermodesulfovibrionales bacterium]|nr:hypothetical protein [Thermodesulfovibrionales bacterium]
MLVSWSFLVLAGITAGQEAAGVSVEVSPSRDATIYRISSKDCSITWTAYGSELNRGVVKHSSRCPDPLSSQLPLMSEILKEFLARDAYAAVFRTLFWGGLVPETGPSALEMPFRLALAAHRSPGWDAKKGRPVRGDINGFVKDLANRDPIYPELKELFGHFQKSITLAAVEKVRVMKAKDLLFYERLSAEGVQAAAKLPFDCMAWF